MTNKIRFYLLAILIVIILLYVLALVFNLYGRTPIDTLQHFLSGLGLALLWWWLITKKQLIVQTSALIVNFSIIGFVLLVGLAWEVFEFSLWQFSFEVAQILKLYSPSIADLLTDLSADLAGALVALIWLPRKFKNSSRLPRSELGSTSGGREQKLNTEIPKTLMIQP